MGGGILLLASLTLVAGTSCQPDGPAGSRSSCPRVPAT